jgi:uncharacterized membrane protein
VSEPRVRWAAPFLPHKLPMMAHLEPGLGLAIGAVLGILVALLIPPGQGWSVRLGAALDATMVCALVHPWLIILTSTPEQTRQRAAVDFPGRTTFGLIKLLVSLAGLVAAVWLLRPVAPGTSTTQTVVDLALGIVAIASSWLLLHTAYTMRYAHFYFYANTNISVDASADPQAGGLAFAGAPPDDLDFAYFAFTIGMAFQTSDTGVTTHRMRRTVLVHALLSFVYNTTIVALAISLIAGHI